MKAYIGILIVLLGFQANAMHVQVVGKIENHKLIDRVLAYAVADPNDVAAKAFIFPPVSKNPFAIFMNNNNIELYDFAEGTIVFKLHTHWLQTN